MLTVFILLVSLITIYIIKIQNIDRPSKRILYLYSLYWFISLFLSTLGLYDYKVPKFETLFCLCISCWALIGGFLLIKCPVKSVDLKQSGIQLSIRGFFKNKLFVGVLVVLTCYSLYLLYKFYTFMALGDLYQIRNLYFESGDLNIYGELFPNMNYWILKPFSFLCAGLFGFGVLYYRSKLLLLIFVMLFSLSSLGGGRLDYFRYLVIPLLLFGYCFYPKRFKVTLKKGFLILVMAAAMFFLLTIIGAGRRGYMEFDKESLDVGVEMTTENLMSYSYGPIVAFDYALNNNYLDKLGGYSYGTLTFNAFNGLLDIAFRMIGISYGTNFSDFVILKQDTWITLSRQNFDKNWNALFSWNFYFYLDFGIVGMIVLPFLFGFLIRKSIYWFYRYQNVSSMMLLSILFLSLILSVLDFNLSSIPIGILMIYLYMKSHNCKLK